jgi:non-heme chloroperoxidase
MPNVTEPTASELAQVERANTSGKQPVVFVHGLWLLDSSWDRWAAFFEEAGYAAVTPGWPDDPASVEAAHENPDAFADKSVGDVAAYQQAVVERLDVKPAVIGHSFGGLLAMMLAGRGLSAATVAIDAVGGRGVLPVPASALKAAFPVLSHTSNRHKAVTLTFDQFRYGFANAVDEEQAQRIYEQFHVAGSGVPVFQAAFSNLNPGSEAKADHKNPERGPMLIVSGELDHQAPDTTSKSIYKRQRKNKQSETEYAFIPGRGHSLTIDDGWQEIAQVCLDFISRHVK